jgi:hypothetical protein
MEELKYPIPNDDSHIDSNDTKLQGNVIINLNNDSLDNYGELTTKTLNCMSINNPYGDIHSSSNISVNGELFVSEKTTLQNDVELSSENFRTIIRGNLDARILNVDNEINSVILNTNSLNTDSLNSLSLNTNSLNVLESSNMTDVTVSGNLMILGEITYLNKNIEINPTSNLSDKYSCTDNHIVFGSDNSEGSWRIKIINGQMHFQKHSGMEWVTKGSFE